MSSSFEPVLYKHQMIICLNIKKEPVIKAHWWLDLRVA